MNVKKFGLYICKWLGLFRLSRYFEPSGLRILCYHGFAIADESDFRPKLFILPDTFKKRLTYLSRKRFPIVGLQDGLEKLRSNSLPKGAAVITIDDGFYSVLQCAAPLLRSASFPSTLYVTSYYCQKESPIFRLAVQYIFWKTRDNQLELANLVPTLSGTVQLNDAAECQRVMWEIINYGESQLSESERIDLTRRTADHLHVNYDSIFEGRYLSLMTLSELRELAKYGVDIQLHTHRHKLPDEEGTVRREITDNRAVLEPVAGKPLQHLCYPSGIWSEKSWPWLTSLQVKSATTCDPGLNLSTTPALGLKRFLDGENIAQIEFESEMCGFNDVLRTVRRAFSA
ncbi:MAG: polysaccharide deacetylase family protein [Candidatus Acidiferrales bacterium]